MKITGTERELHTTVSVQDGAEERTFIRFGPDCWYEFEFNGCTSVWDCRELEALFQGHNP